MNGDFTPEKKAAMMDEIISAGASSLGVANLANKVSLVCLIDY